jgi:hypothetical protein
MAGGAVAADKFNKDEVTVVTLTGGPVQTGAADQEVTIPLNGASTYSFTQHAGEALQLITRVDADKGTSSFCEISTYVFDTVGSSSNNNGGTMGTRVDNATDRGGPGFGLADISGLPAPASDTTVTLRAFTQENGPNCDNPNIPTTGTGNDDSWTVSVRVSVVTLRN